MPTLENVDRFMTNMIELNTATTAKLHSLADLNMQLGQKIDRLGIRLDQQAINIDRLIDHGKQIDARLGRLAEISGSTERKLDQQAINIDRLITGVGELVEHGKQIDARLDRIAEGLDQLAGIASGTERKLDRLIEALTKRNGKKGQ